MNSKPRSIASFLWRHLNGMVDAHYTFMEWDDHDQLNSLLRFLNEGATLLRAKNIYSDVEIDKKCKMFREIIITKSGAIRINPKVHKILNGVNKTRHREFMEYLRQRNPWRINAS